MFQWNLIQESRQRASFDPQVSCALPALALECCFPLLNDAMLIYLYTSKQNTWTITRTMRVDTCSTLATDWAHMRRLSLGPAETYNQPVPSILFHTLNPSPSSHLDSYNGLLIGHPFLQPCPGQLTSTQKPEWSFKNVNQIISSLMTCSFS